MQYECVKVHLIIEACVWTYLIDQSSVVVDFLQLSPDTDLKTDPIAILVLSCVVISQYKAFIPPIFSQNLTTVTMSYTLGVLLV